MPDRLLAIIIALALALALLLFVGALIAAAVRSMQRGRRGTSGSLSGAALEVQSMLEPSRRHVLVAVRRDESDEDENGDPPK